MACGVEKPAAQVSNRAMTVQYIRQGLRSLLEE
jgi:hypothetical protein